jgi:hypothetical protein
MGLQIAMVCMSRRTQARGSRAGLVWSKTAKQTRSPLTREINKPVNRQALPAV